LGKERVQKEDRVLGLGVPAFMRPAWRGNRLGGTKKTKAVESQKNKEASVEKKGRI